MVKRVRMWKQGFLFEIKGKKNEERGKQWHIGRRKENEKEEKREKFGWKRK